MKIVVFLSGLGVGGTEKAACRWARGFKERGHEVCVLALQDGPRRADLEQYRIPLRIIKPSAPLMAGTLTEISPDVIHVHAPGYPHPGDVLGDALKLLPAKIPVIQTNIFGKLENQHENEWTDFRLFVSWMGAVQAARRSFRKLDENFFRSQSVAINPLDADDGPQASLVKVFRARHGIKDDEIVFGHLARPDPIRWDNKPLAAFHAAVSQNRKIKMLLREPPPEITRVLGTGPDADRFLILPVTVDVQELRLTTAAMDVVVHYSRIGESFGYGVAEPMNMGKPAIVNSTPADGQAQIELVRHGECGYVASTPAAMAKAMLVLVNDPALRQQMGARAQQHIRALADPNASLDRLEAIFHAALGNRDNPFAAADLHRARETAAYLDAHQFGHSFAEQITLRPFYYRVRFHQFRKALFLRRSAK